jgi:hypothetical protein
VLIGRGCGKNAYWKKVLLIDEYRAPGPVKIT